MCERSSFHGLVALIGRDSAMALIGRYAGVTLHIPATAKPGGLFDELAQVIGEDHARRIIQRYARTGIYIPLLSSIKREQRLDGMRHEFDTLILRLCGR